MEYYVKGDNRKGYSNREELDKEEEEEEEEEEEDKNNIMNSTKYLSSPCYNNYGSSPSLQTAEAINFMDLLLTNPKDDNNNNSNDNDWPPDNEREHMFDKVVTPSDVGKLNRLVIPKQHAEKYFPLDSSANEKGLLLNFVDRAGKPWRFRYSYWNSSQSYVMTKGWSRFVKDKKLDAGDIVSFQRSVKDSNVLYIDWRRRPPPPLSPHQQAYPFWGTCGGGGQFYLPSMPMPFRHHHDNYNIHHPYNHHIHHHNNQYQFQHTSPYQMQPYYRNGHGGTGSHQSMVIDSVPIGQFQPHHSQQVMKAMSPASNKRLRLFGVNMECSSTTTMQEDEGQKILASTVASLAPHQQLNPVELRLLPKYGAPLGGADDDQQQQLGVSEKGKSTCLSFCLDP